MTIYTLNLLFPIILGIHNAEEYGRHDDFIRDYPARVARYVSPPVVRAAMVWLTLAAAVVSVLAWIYRTSWLLDIALVADFALLLNAFGHIGRSMYRRSLTPGTVSAVCLVLPYSAVVTAMLRHSENMSWGRIASLLALGVPAIPVTVAICLALGYAVSARR
jgi:hypothetical protein